MDKCNLKIAIAEPSEIIYEGLVNILTKAEHHFNIYRNTDWADLKIYIQENAPDIVILNPLQVQNKLKLFKNFKKNTPGTYWIAIVYSLFEDGLLSLFDETIAITDTPESIAGKVHKLIQAKCSCDHPRQEQLSEREIDVLVLLTRGLSNKEIADKLNISTHTVVSHRKNITQKTGIKSLSGLTIYAITQDIISLDDYSE